jgi:ATP-dependent DNA ligase
LILENSIMLLFSQTADRIAATTKKLEKTAILAEYFRSVRLEDAAVAAVFFSGRPFPVWEETTLQVGGSMLWRMVAELAGKSEHALTEAYRKYGDLGAVAEAVLPQIEPRTGSLPRLPSDAKSPAGIQRIFREISAARRPAFKAVIVKQLLEDISPLEAKYVIKIMTGDLRIGLKESLVEEAIAKTFAHRHPETTLKAVQRANMLLGDIGETLKLAAEGRLGEAKMRLFHPIGFMLASPAESAVDALSYFQNAWVEDKYDGIRAQAHCSGDDVRFFSRTRDQITESFPELPDALADLPSDAILDGEILAWDYSEGESSYDVCRRSSENQSHVASHTSHGRGSSDAEYRSSATVEPLRDEAPEERPSLAQRGSTGNCAATGASPGGTTDDLPGIGRALPFSALQKRLGRKMVSDALIREVPLAYLVFDVLYANGELVIDKPLRERAKILDELLAKTTHHRGTETRRRKTTTEVQGFLDFRPAEKPEPTTDNCLPTTNDQRLTPGLRMIYDVRRAANSPILDEQQPRPAVIRAPVFQASSPDELNALFDAAQARGNEGLMIKDPESPYSPGRRGKSWLKLKRELATIDVVVTAVEFGHGRRIGVLSDYTFAVRDGEQLLNVGKAYSGLTDTEIAEMTKWFLDHTIEDQGFRRVVEPKIVIEVAFNNVMQSDRHNSGYALRFPRIVRLRPDKLPEEADTLGRVKEIYGKQNKSR